MYWNVHFCQFVKLRSWYMNVVFEGLVPAWWSPVALLYNSEEIGVSLTRKPTLLFGICCKVS